MEGGREGSVIHHFHTCRALGLGSVANQLLLRASSNFKAMAPMKAMKAMKAKKAKAMKAKKAMKSMKTMKKAKSMSGAFEFVVLVCRGCKEAKEIVSGEGATLSFREYYCCLRTPLEVHHFVVPPPMA